ncbi:alpha/beta fold hydrolase [Actinoplanes sp. NPDC049599]|uniref:alpha/beta fold hydrolase n=1 Tax=Actinoplanes sp. NPDC049599 TaxID=3363903 RepID=UPI0037985A22
MGERLRRVTTPDGRTLGVARWGAPDGTPVLSLHGTPGSRLWRHPDEDAVRRAGINLITYDRPGYGASDRHPGRRVVDCVGDVAAVADALGISRFAVTGRSGGGPHALAVAARLPDRVTAAECVVGVAPFAAAGLDWTAGMDPENVTEFGWARQGEQVLHRELAALAAADLARMTADPAKVLADDWQLAAADRQVLARVDVQQVLVETVREAHRPGVHGWVDDDLAFLSPWGFEVTEIRVPVMVRYGRQDVMVPAAHGAWLAGHIPGASVAVDEQAGHLVRPEQFLDRITALTGAHR